MTPPTREEVPVEDDGSGPRARTLVIFGICLALVIVAIIVGAALVGG